MKHYSTMIQHVKDYEEEIGKRLKLSDVNLDFYNGLLTFYNDLKIAKNTLGNAIKDIKVIMKLAFEEGVSTNTEYQKSKFRKLTEETDQIYLSDAELKMINDAVLPDSLARYRDLFLIAAYTGLRYSDLSNLDNFHIRPPYVKIRTQKTGERVVIPIHPVLKQVLERNNYEIPPVPSNQKFNEYIKDVCEIAEIKEICFLGKTIGGKYVQDKYPKYKLVSAHTARRSFATNMYLAGVPSISIMKITGHHSEKSFLKYIRISQEDNAQKLLDHPYFK